MRPGRMKYKARARRRRIAVTAAGVSALTVLGGTAYATEGGGNYHGGDDGEVELENGGDATTTVEQESKVYTDQLAYANTGANEALAITANINLGEQDCTTNLDGGNLADVEEENTAGNKGGNCDNDAKQRNHGTADASIDTGDARSHNSSETKVNQRNSGHASVENTANDNELEGDDGDVSLSNGGDAYLTVDQDSKVRTWQSADANTGYNTALAAVIGVNYGTQTGTTNVSGGNITDADDDNHAGNDGGNASNNAHQTNNGSATASITTGNANASNSSSTTVNQTNSGGASSTNTANGNKLSSD